MGRDQAITTRGLVIPRDVVPTARQRAVQSFQQMTVQLGICHNYNLEQTILRYACLHKSLRGMDENWQDLGTHLTGPDSVEALVQHLVEIIGKASEVSIAPGCGRMSSQDIGKLARCLLNTMLFLFGTPAPVMPCCFYM